MKELKVEVHFRKRLIEREDGELGGSPGPGSLPQGELQADRRILEGFNISISHVAIWYWVQRMGKKIAVWKGPLLPRIVVDETWVKMEGKDCWIFAAIDPETWRVIYVEPH